jgi:hypothetical protein
MERIRPYFLPFVVALIVMVAVCVVIPKFLVSKNMVGLAVVALTIVLESLRGKPAKRIPSKSA